MQFYCGIDDHLGDGIYCSRGGSRGFQRFQLKPPSPTSAEIAMAFYNEVLDTADSVLIIRR